MGKAESRKQKFRLPDLAHAFSDIGNYSEIILGVLAIASWEPNVFWHQDSLNYFP